MAESVADSGSEGNTVEPTFRSTQEQTENPLAEILGVGAEPLETIVRLRTSRLTIYRRSLSTRPVTRSKLAWLQPIVRLSLYLASLAVTSTVAARLHVPQTPAQPPPQESQSTLDRAPCPSGTLEDGSVCVPVPQADGSERDALVAKRNVHRTRTGAWAEYEQIPRQPDRPRDYDLYRYPIQPLAGQSLMMSGYDLNLPNDFQRRGPRLKAVGHGGIDLAQRRGAEVHLVSLEYQQGPAEVLYVGWLFGNTVVTLHQVREAGANRQYMVLHGHLERPRTGLDVGALVDDGELLGFVGDSDSPGVIHLHLEIRQIRAGVEARLLAPSEIVDNARTVACDPRNLLPLLTAP